MCAVRVLFGKLAFGSGFLQKERKGELSRFPVPTEPPLLAAARQPPLVQSVRAPVSVYVYCLHATVNLCDGDRDARGKFPLAKNASGDFFAMSPAPWPTAPKMLSLSLHYFASPRLIYLQF